MRKNRKFLITKIVLIAAAVPIIIHAYATGPLPAYTGAPGDNKTGCIASGCHSGTPNSGPGSLKILLPTGNTGTYTPGQSMQLMVQISDSTKGAYGFQLTARSGSNGLTQAGDFSTTDANTQVFCPDSSSKVNGKTCPSQFPIEYIEHTYSGFLASQTGKGTYTYSFSWTPPATAVGNVTLYVAGNAGLAGQDIQTPTNVYLTSMALTPAAASTNPAITNVQDAASARTTVVPGEWVAIYGSNLSGTTRKWASADFNGNNLPTTLDKVSVNFGTLPAPVFFISPGQIDVQAPSGISGTVPVTVTYNGTASASFNTTVAANAPTFFTYASGSNTFAAAQNFPSYSTVGDPAVTSGTAKATPGQTVILYLNGLASSPSGTLISPPINYSGTVTVALGNTSPTVSFAGLVAAGLYQVNITIPTGLAAGIYPISLTTAGQTTQSGVSLIVGP
jgi:uncharacterized protein (TIGR03437 family)